MSTFSTVVTAVENEVESVVHKLEAAFAGIIGHHPTEAAAEAPAAYVAEEPAAEPAPAPETPAAA